MSVLPPAVRMIVRVRLREMDDWRFSGWAREDGSISRRQAPPRSPPWFAYFDFVPLGPAVSAHTCALASERRARCPPHRELVIVDIAVRDGEACARTALASADWTSSSSRRQAPWSLHPGTDGTLIAVTSVVLQPGVCCYALARRAARRLTHGVRAVLFPLATLRRLVRHGPRSCGVRSATNGGKRSMPNA